MYFLFSLPFWLLVAAVVFLFIRVSKLKKRQDKIIERIESLYSMEKVGERKESLSEKKEISEETPRYIVGDDIHGVKEENGKDNETSKPIFVEEKKETEYHWGAKVLPAIGVVSVIFGIGFFLKYAFDNNLIDEMGRVILGFISGILFIFLGDYLRKKYQNYGILLMGGGFVILYLAAKFGLVYSLYGNAMAFIIMTLVTLVAVLFAYKKSSKVVALISLVGGFLVPVLSASGSPNEMVLFNYILILLLGMFFLVWKRGWS